MAGVSAPIIDLTSDLECGIYTYSQNEDVFTLDWAEDDIPLPHFTREHIENVLEEETLNKPIPEAKIDDIAINDESQTQNVKSLKGKKIVRKALREEKKAEELKQKQIKAALAKKHKSLKPEENIKLITVHIDTKIVNSELGGAVITSLSQLGIQYEVGTNIKPSTISWSKKIKEILVSSEDIIEEDVCEKEEDQLLYLLYCDVFVKLVSQNDLLTHIETIKSVYPNRLVTVVIFGMQKYFDLQKKRFNNASNGKKTSKKNVRNYSDDNIYITKDEYDSALIELQLLSKCNNWPIESGEELASLVITTTKSLSQIDYKKEKRKRDESDLDWFAKADSKNCVKIDKNGNGLMKLWQQQICQFNAVGIEYANAITSHFHSPLHLVNSYKNCETFSEAELLLQNIQMRREAGILSSSRRIGPEISKKLYRFYTSDDPDLEL